MKSIFQSALIVTSFLTLVTSAFVVADTEVPVTMEGQFRVDESGAAVYSIPIKMLPGRAGVTPQVSLNYSSSNTSISSMGTGWNLSAASVISRCPQTPAHDGEMIGVDFEDTDRFCLDGQRLDLNNPGQVYGAANTVYHTEIDSFSKITAKGQAPNGGPEYFIVETRSGEVHCYGDVSSSDTTCRANYIPSFSADDAFVEPGGFSSGSIAQYWAIKLSSDVKGNFIQYNYEKNTSIGTHRIDEIKYSGFAASSGYEAPYQTIDFDYDDSKVDVARVWQAGGHRLLKGRLTDIYTYIDGELDKTYKLTYNDSSSSIKQWELPKLLSVKECETNASGADMCSTPTDFDWYDIYNQSGSYFTGHNQTITLSSTVSGSKSPRMMDVNGDGMTDLVYIDGSNWKVQLGRLDNYNSTITLGSIGTSQGQYALDIDVDGDGKRDLLVANSATSNWYVYLAKPTSTSYSSSWGVIADDYQKAVSYTQLNLGIPATGLTGSAKVADVNGDGYEDILFAQSGYLKAYLHKGVSWNKNYSVSPFNSTPITLYNLNSSSTPTFDQGVTYATWQLKHSSTFDINGDGKTDLVARISGSACYVNGSPMPFVRSQYECTHDFNGTWTTTTSYKLYVSTIDQNGDYAFEYVQEFGSQYDSNMSLADINGDGNTDLYWTNSNQDNIYYALSDGTKFLNPINANLPIDGNQLDDAIFADFNNDGRTDVLAKVNSTSYQYYFAKPGTNIASGTGATPIAFYAGLSTAKNFGQDALFAADVEGNGRIDLVGVSGSTWKQFYINMEGLGKVHAIKSFTNGFGIQTRVDFGSMTDLSLYVTQASPNDSASTYSPVLPIRLVKRVITFCNCSEYSGLRGDVRYEYGGMLFDRVGYGNLGFEMLRTTDAQTGVVTQTRYDQSHTASTFAKAGMPLETIQFNDSGYQTSYASNTLAQKSTVYGGVFPYISSSTEKSYQLNSDGTTTQLNTTVTTNTYDGSEGGYGAADWGLLTKNIVTITDSDNGNTLSTQTVNTYHSGNDLRLQRARLATATVTKTLSGSSSNTQTRLSKFWYNSDQGVSNAGTNWYNIANYGQQNQLKTEYYYDKYGNQEQTWQTGYLNDTSTNETQKRIVDYSTNGRYPHQDKYVNASGTTKVTSTYYYDDLSANSSTGIVRTFRKTDINGKHSWSHSESLGTSSWTMTFKASTSKYIRTYNQTYFCNSSCPSYFDKAYFYVKAYSMPTDGTGTKLSPTVETYYNRFGEEVGKRTESFSGSWIVTRNDYDSRGRLEAVYSPAFNGVSTDYATYTYDDSTNRLVSLTSPADNWGNTLTTETEYDGYKVTTLKTSNGQTYGEVNESNGFGQTVKTWIFGSGATGSVYSINSEFNPTNYVTFEYDAYGNLLKQKVTAYNKDNVSKTSIITHTYNNATGLKESTNDPDKGIWYYTFNAWGQLLTQKTARNHTSTIQYDRLGRKVKMDRAGLSTLCWNYDPSGGWGLLDSTVLYGSGGVDCKSPGSATVKESTTYSYNSDKQISSIVKYRGGQSFTTSNTYDTYGRVDTVTYPTGTQTFKTKSYYNTYGYQYKTVNANNTSEIYTQIIGMNEWGKVSQVNNSNGTVTTYSVDPATGMMYYTESKKGTVVKSSVDVEADGFGNVIQRDSYYDGGATQVSESYFYDAFHRLSKRTLNSQQYSSAVNAGTPSTFKTTLNYTYDGFGNLLTKADVKNGTLTYHYNPNRFNRLETVTKGTSSFYVMGYDNNGNATRRTGSSQQLYYSTNDMVYQMNIDGKSSSLEYGVDNDLVYKSDSYSESGTAVNIKTYYVGNFEKVVRTGGKKGNLTEYRYYVGNNIFIQRSNGTTTKNVMHKDHQGSVVAVTDASGNVISQSLYGPFGEQIQINTASYLIDFTYMVPTEKGYTGHKMMNEFGIIHMNGRIYDPTLGRFLQADPFIQFANNSQSYNRYAYVLNNPLSHIDPSGYFLGGLLNPLKKIFRAFASVPVLNALMQGIACTAGQVSTSPLMRQC